MNNKLLFFIDRIIKLYTILKLKLNYCYYINLFLFLLLIINFIIFTIRKFFRCKSPM